MDDYTLKNLDRFWSKVDLSKADEEFTCWEWTGRRHKKGYGQSWWRGRNQHAHRTAFELAFGAFSPRLWVLHHCDNPACVNPNHLFLGTNTDNVRDKMLKGRHVASFGEENGACKLSDAQVTEIRHRYNSAEKKRGLQTALAKEFDVSQTLIWYIVHDKWRTIPLKA